MGKQAKAITVHRTQLADLLNVTPDHISRLVGQGMPTLTTGNGRGRHTTFDLRAALHWWISADGDARERLWLAQAARAEFDLAVKRGEFIEMSEAQRDAANVSRAVCMKLRAVPNAQIEQILSIGAQRGRGPAATFLLAAIDTALRELAALGDAATEEKTA